MTDKCWAHVFAGQHRLAEASKRIASHFGVDGMISVLEGQNVKSLTDFYPAIASAVPVVANCGRNCGRNCGALEDLFSSHGSGGLEGQTHAFVWLNPDLMLAHSPNDFWTVCDIIVGAAKELLVGDELDEDFDPEDENDWLSTRLLVVFECRQTKVAQNIAENIACLSGDWKDTFHSLAIDVELHAEPL